MDGSEIDLMDDSTTDIVEEDKFIVVTQMIMYHPVLLMTIIQKWK